MLSKQLRKVSCLSLNNMPSATTTSYSLQELKSFTSKTENLVSDIHSLTAGEGDLKFSTYPWLNNSECMQNSMISELLEQVKQKLDLSNSGEFDEISEKFKESELFLLKCETLGIPQNEAKNLLTLLKIFNLQPPQSFSHKDMAEVLQKAKRFSTHHKEEYLNCLREQVKELENKLSPLKEQVKEMKIQAHEFSGKSIQLGTLAVVSQVFGLVFFAFPTVQVFQVAGFGLAGVAGFWKFSGKVEILRQSIYRYRFSKLVAKQQVKVERILYLQQELDTIRKKIIDLH